MSVAKLARQIGKLIWTSSMVRRVGTGRPSLGCQSTNLGLEPSRLPQAAATACLFHRNLILEGILVELGTSKAPFFTR